MNTNPLYQIASRFPSDPEPAEQSFVVVFGPPGSGKTLNKAALMAHYRCDHVFDAEWEDFQIARSRGRILILSHNEEVRDPRDRRRVLTHRRRLLSDVLLVPVREAALALGDKWQSTPPFANAR